MTVPFELPRCDGPPGECHLCGDVAMVGRVLQIDEATRTGVVLLQNDRETIALDLVEVRVGDQVLVHLGFAIDRVEVS